MALLEANSESSHQQLELMAGEKMTLEERCANVEMNMLITWDCTSFHGHATILSQNIAQKSPRLSQ